MKIVIKMRHHFLVTITTVPVGLPPEDHHPALTIIPNIMTPLNIIIHLIGKITLIILKNMQIKLKNINQNIKKKTKIRHIVTILHHQDHMIGKKC